jgi:glycosyltransferase involved in cell wall biosynthesis
MKLTVLAGGFAPVGGIESFLFELLSAMSARRIESEIYCWDGVAPRRNPLLATLPASGVRVHRSPWRWGCRWAWPDKLLLAASGEALLATDVLLFGKPLSAAAHRRLQALRGASGTPKFVLVTPYRPAEMGPDGPRPELFAPFDAIAVQAHSFAGDLRSMGYQGTIAVLPYVPPACTPVTPLPFAPLRIGFLGRFAEAKNLPYLLHAFREVLRRRPAILKLFGEGPLRAELEELALRLGILPAVRFCGLVPPGGVPAAVDSCSLFAFTSATEGQCLAALEILARGRRLVATPVGAFPEMLEDARLGRTAPPRSPEDFAAALLSVAAEAMDPAEVQHAFAAAFDRGSVIDSYVSLLRSWSSSPSLS